MCIRDREHIASVRLFAEALTQPVNNTGDTLDIIVLRDYEADKRFKRLLPEYPYARIFLAGKLHMLVLGELFYQCVIVGIKVEV